MMIDFLKIEAPEWIPIIITGFISSKSFELTNLKNNKIQC